MACRYRFVAFCIGFSGLGMAVAAATPPGISDLKILTSVVDVTKHPPSPKLRLDISGDARQLTLIWTGPSGQKFQQDFSGNWTGGTVFQGTNFENNLVALGTANLAFNLYTQPGLWTLSSLKLCNDECLTMNGPNLGTVTVKNRNKFDVTPPVVESGAVDTPTITLADLIAHGARITFKVSDDVSGIGYLNVQAKEPHGNIMLFQSNLPNHPLLAGPVTARTAYYSTNLPPASYTVDLIYVSDTAGNVSNPISDPATISQLLGGHPTIKLIQ